MTAPTVPGPRGRGRPPVGPQVAVNLPPEILARVDELAAATGGTRSETIRVLVTDMIGALFTDPED